MMGMNWTNVAAELVAEERIDLPAVIAVDGVDRAEHVPIDVVALQHLQALHHTVEGGLAALVHAIGVVHLPRPVDRDADEEPVLLQERPPLVVQERPVRLHRVQHVLAGLRVALLELDRAGEEVQAHHRGLPALPGHDHFRRSDVGLHELADVGLVDL